MSWTPSDVPTSADQDEDWFGWLAEAQQILSDWEAQLGRLLPTQDAVALIDRIAHGLERSFERGKAQSQDDLRVERARTDVEASAFSDLEELQQVAAQGTISVDDHVLALPLRARRGIIGTLLLVTVKSALPFGLATSERL